MSRNRAPLGFAQIACMRCGSDRVIGVPCPDCGLAGRPNEVNDLVVQRKTLVSRVVANGEHSASGDSPTASDLQNWLNQFAKSLAQCINAPMSMPSALAMSATLARLNTWQSFFKQEALRPGRAEARAYAAVVENLSRLWPIYAKAMQTLDLREAQALAIDGQELLNRAAEPLTELQERERIFEPMTDFELGSALERSLACLSRLYPGQSLSQIEEIENANLRETLFLAKTPAGLGVEIGMSRALAAVFYDEQRFENNFRTSFELLVKAGPLVSEVAAQPRALSSLSDALRAQTDAFEAFTRATDEEHDSRFALRQLLRLHAEVMEECLLPVLAWFVLTLGLKTKNFDKLLEEDSTSLAASLKSSGYGHLIEGADSFMRHAASHGHSYELVGDTVNFKLRSFTESLSLPQLADKTLALFESVNSMTLALRAYLGHVDLMGSDTNLRFGGVGISNFRLASYALDQSRCKLLASEDLAQSWHFTVDTDQPSLVIASSIASIQDASDVSIVVARPGVEGFAQVPREPFDAYIAASGDLTGADLVLTTLELLEQCKDKSGYSLAGANEVRFAIGCLGIFLLDRQDRSVISHLRRLRRLVLRLELKEELADIDVIFSAFTTGKMISRSFRETLREAIDGPEPRLPTAGTVELI
jgi:hypothetical protein